MKAKHLTIPSTVVLAACTGKSELDEANTKIGELQVWKSLPTQATGFTGQ